ncbi:prepilin-type N-terminal cleavage/methylation domain-containing protein [Coraliomargarita sp. SDUM461004]|uniref:Prepilin-type N-terminal cleavage/methylation domain-containing protein n=1 Tax=Thalassobacterium sedimentorum TaxID=3041258 RepID=A0ABU1AIB6_9BACT|nr:prepilin-type N-terminal cleavage/methylation domain-containing protein [Coraliomargarita sp. SDUM461004]MDQ8193373.1 prepilin-type N-terminal cleavage/methylation domain-containing protein [Coraliomargarita sp. SDUM461004]
MQQPAQRAPISRGRIGATASCVTNSAFTLLEVILAVTIAGALLAAAATLLVSVTDVWMERQDRHFFEDHVDGVAEFLQASFIVAGTEIALSTNSNTPGTANETSEPANNENNADTNAGTTINVPTPDNTEVDSNQTENEDDSGSGLISVAEDPIDWSKPPGFADYQDPLLHFKLMETPPLLIQTQNAPTVGIEAFLHFEHDEGLSLLWYTPLQEDSEDISDLNRTPISDLITKVEYIYWDENFEKWETETEAKEGDGDEQFILPRFLKLTFEYRGETKVRTLTIPVPSRSVLLF